MKKKLSIIICFLAVANNFAWAEDYAALETRAMKSFEIGKLQRAKRDLQYLIREVPGEARYHMQLANVYYAQGKQSEAEDSVDQALVLDGTHVPALLSYASRLNNAGDQMGAIATYELVLAQDEENADALQALASLWEEAGDQAKADSYLEQYRELLL